MCAGAAGMPWQCLLITLVFVGPWTVLSLQKKGVLAVFSFVEIPAGRRNSFTLLPYHGSGWCNHVAVEHMLHYGLVTWADIYLSLFATGQVPPYYLADPLGIMENAWGENLDLAKLSVNQMIGLWAIDARQIYHVKTSNDPCDGIGAWARDS